jgi:catechol 2,3-dioxygenase-like lactoylglutathione lyase family enzyme
LPVETSSKQFWSQALHVGLISDTITLNEVPEKAGTTGGIDHFGFRLVDKGQLDRAIQEVERAGGRLVERGVRATGRPYAYVLDPDGYTIEL